MNIYNAARAAGYSHAYAHKAKVEKVAKVSMADAFEQAGLTDKAIITHALEGLEAMRTVSAIITGKDAGAADKDFIDVPDWSARHKYFETVLKMTDRLKEKSAVEINNYNQIWQGACAKSAKVNANGRLVNS